MEMEEIFDKLQAVADRYDELNELISDPEVIADTARFMKLSKEEGSLRETVEKYNEYKQVMQTIKDDEEMLREIDDPDLTAMTKDEIASSKERQATLEKELEVLLIPKDPNDDKNIIMEIRGAAGGDEASLFAADLYDMYLRYAEKQGWKVEVVDKNETEVGGFKEISLLITGDKVYSKLKFENGAHRVQRVPVTESAGRVHTSTATVGVMPEAEDVEIDIDPKDIRTDVYRSSGAGGQHINKTSSAVRITHLPTGIVTTSQAQRSQLQNRETAMNELRAKLFHLEEEKKRKQKQALKGDQKEIGWGSQIRSYVFHPYNLVKDLRTGYETADANGVMDGKLQPFIYSYLQWLLSQENPE